MTTATTNTPATRSDVTTFDLKQGGLQITNSSQMFEMAKFFANSELVPQCYQGKPANIIVAWQKGAELGLSPTQALDGIAVINGRASVWGEAATALVLSSGLCEQHSLSYHGDGENLTARCTVKRKGMTQEMFEFSVKDAKAANLWGKNTWKSYPRDMLAWKAKARAYRSMFADCLKGIMINEDMMGNDIHGRAIVTSVQSSPLHEALDGLESSQGDEEIIEQPSDPFHSTEHQAEEPKPSSDAAPSRTWHDAVNALMSNCDIDIDSAEEIIIDAIAGKYQKDPSELTAEQVEATIAAVESGKITA